jgi:putative FmdB family regulatory protein
MPIYTFQCGCGVQFEHRVSFKKMDDPHNCPACGTVVQRNMPGGMNYTINQSVTGPIPQNSGYSGIDANVDRVVGRDAEDKWKVIDTRDTAKRELLRQSDTEEKSRLSRNPDGTYRVMDDTEAETSDRVQLFNNVAMGLLKSRKRKLSSADN